MSTNTATKPAARLKTPTDLGANAFKDLAGALNAILADTFALYLKTKNFHWHVSGPHFRDYHLMFDEQAAELLASTDEIAERVRKIGGNTLRSIGDISRQQTIDDNDKPYVSPDDMLEELHEDTMATIKAMRAAHKKCDDAEDIGTASLLENFIDQAEKRAWFLFETARKGAPSGH
jgi:starvation-inducible DNA-binding protein